MSRQHEWWQHGVIYQIYPRSFQDSNGDGIGDLPGICSRLDYVERLGVDALWLSPIFPSPMADFGYDISNYVDIDPVFGTLADFDRLAAEIHRRRMKIVLDFVPNHTSIQHPWFAESRSSRASPKRQWYIWRDPAPDGGPPNNWLSNFGGSAWSLDERTGQYYYHAFLDQQPDLNWRNPDVQDAMLGVLRFWLERGVDGFRVDVIWHIVKDDQFRDNLPNPNYLPTHAPHRRLLATYNTDRPEVHDIIGRMRAVLDCYGERMMVGEIYLPVERLIEYYGAQGSGVHLPFNFQLIELPWHARAIADAIDRYENLLPPYGWPNWVLGNHDNPRIATRIGPAQARVAAMLLLTLRGTPTLYYGDEIGMANVPIPPDRIQDPFEKNVPGMGLGRDPQRTPMQWSSNRYAGFSDSAPWLPLADDFETTNVQTLATEPRSLFNLYKQLIELRRREAALSIGRFFAIAERGDLLSYYRRFDKGTCFLIILNLGSEPAIFHNPTVSERGTVALSTHLDRKSEQFPGHIALRGDEGLVIELHDR